MTTEEVMRAVRDAVGSHTGDERELYEQLDAEAEGWRMRLQELDDEESD